MALGLLFVPFLPFTVSSSMIILPKSSAKIIVFSELEKYLLLKIQFLFGLTDYILIPRRNQFPFVEQSSTFSLFAPF